MLCSEKPNINKVAALLDQVPKVWLATSPFMSIHVSIGHHHVHHFYLDHHNDHLLSFHTPPTLQRHQLQLLPSYLQPNPRPPLPWMIVAMNLLMLIYLDILIFWHEIFQGKISSKIFLFSNIFSLSLKKIPASLIFRSGLPHLKINYQEKVNNKNKQTKNTKKNKMAKIITNTQIQRQIFTNLPNEEETEKK